jgi:hypothetical protein
MVTVFICILLAILLYLAIDNYSSVQTQKDLIIKHLIFLSINLTLCGINYFEHDWGFFTVNISCIILLLKSISNLMKK